MIRTVIASFVLVIVTSAPAFAQATRTWVSGVGDDANPCSRTAPCKTFAGAISKTAAGGYISVLDPGGFGAVTITKSITIDGNGTVAGILAAGTNGINISTGAGTVILRNLSIEGAGTGLNGIRVLVANAKVHVEHVTIKNFTQNGILVTQNAELYVSDSTIKGITGQAVYLQAGRGAIERVVTNGNGVGVLAGTTAIVTVKDSEASGNDIGYMAAYAATAQISVEDSIVSHNDFGVAASFGATSRLSRVSVFNNTTAGLSNDGASFLVSFGNNSFAGNAADGAFTSTVLLK